VLRIDRDVIERELGAQLHESTWRLPCFAPARRLEGPGGRIALLVAQLTRALAAAGNGSTAPRAVAHLERLLVTALLEGHAHDRSAALAGSARAGEARSLRRAEDFIHSALERPVSIGDIARAAGLSARTLFREFQRRHGCSPMEYLRHARLERVRCRLEAGAAASVTEAAFEAGFAHLSRFAGFYRQAFGEMPSQTLRRAQRAAWPRPAAARASERRVRSQPPVP
jgi:transcriptional regulator GlxA family with amidase domain